MTEEPNVRTATAYHEAGHAVMALLLGRPVEHVTILATRAELGTCWFGKPVFRPSEDWLQREALISLAGMAAESRHTGIEDRAAALRDLRHVQELALQRTGNARQAARLERRLFAKAEHLLGKAAHWKAIETIARELLRVGEISGRAARHFFEECLKAEE